MKKISDKRLRLIEAANQRVYRQGFNQTSLADVAADAQVPLGNVYHYFRTKEALGEALIHTRSNNFRALRDQWDKLPAPKDRLLAYIQMTIDASEMLAQGGCPIGSLCQELHKQGGPLADKAAGMFTEALGWLETQFRQLGKGTESADLGVHLMSVLQGAALLTNSFKKTGYIVNEANRMKEWVCALP